MSWDDAIQVVTDALSKNKPGEIAFLMGMAPDHIFDLVTDPDQSHRRAGSDSFRRAGHV